MKALHTIMALVIIVGLLVWLPVTNAQEASESEDHEDPGITPDSFLYGLDVALDKIRLLLTFDQAEKSKKGLEIARERLIEVKAMAEQNKTKAMIKAKNEHDQMLDRVKGFIKNIEKDNSTEEIDEEIEVEKELEKHVMKLEEIRGELKVKLKIKGDITPEQQSVIESVLSAMENKTGEVGIEIKNKKGKTKMEIKVKTGKSDEEIEDEITEHEARKGLTDIKKEKAYDRIEDAREEIAKAKSLLGNSTNNATSALLTQAERHLENAIDAYDTGDFGKAYGQATAAENIAESIKEEVEETEIEKHGPKEDEENETEFEIEAEIMDNETLVKVEVNGEKTAFTLATVSRAGIVLEVATRLGISSDQVERVIEFEDEDDNSFEQGFEVGNKTLEKKEKKEHKKTVEIEEVEVEIEDEVVEDEIEDEIEGEDEIEVEDKGEAADDRRR